MGILKQAPLELSKRDSRGKPGREREGYKLLPGFQPLRFHYWKKHRFDEVPKRLQLAQGGFGKPFRKLVKLSEHLKPAVCRRQRIQKPLGEACHAKTPLTRRQNPELLPVGKQHPPVFLQLIGHPRSLFRVRQ